MGILADKLMMCTGGGLDVLPEAIDFDGTNDYLSRSSDLVGNADGKTFTFSGWAYQIKQSSIEQIFLYSNGPTSPCFLRITDTGQLSISFRNTGGSEILTFNSSANAIPLDTFTHILLSVDLTSTSNRYLYINNVLVSVTWSTYTNDSINFTNTSHAINSQTGSVLPASCRLSNLYLDYTYRDLSIEANRRLFITEEGKPAADQASLNPILYLPLTDPDTAGTNLGTGGNFVLNGTVDTSGRGPNQDNCVASEFDGSADYLSSNGITGIANGKTGTIAFTVKPQENDNHYIFDAYTGGASHFTVTTSVNGGYHQINGYNSSTSLIFHVRSSVIPVIGKYQTVAITWDLANASNRSVEVDGVIDSSASWLTYIDDDIDYTESGYNIGAIQGGFAKILMQLSELWFDNTYGPDLSIFWDSDLNLPKPVRQVLEETSATPLIAMPIRGDNAGLNLGTGGDFTVNSGPFAGARGASEFWARSANFDGSTGYLNASITGLLDSKTCTMAVVFKSDAASGRVFNMKDGGGIAYDVFDVIYNGTNIVIDAFSGGTRILRATTSTPSISTGNWFILLFSVDLSNTSSRSIFINGINASPTWSTYTDQFIDFTEAGAGNRNIIGALDTGGGIAQYFSGDIGFLYFTTDYIDFSQESNRLLFVDGLGYPTDLQKKIDDAEVPTPLIYMPFNDPDDLGKNLGTGGDFTVNGTVAPGADVKG